MEINPKYLRLISVNEEERLENDKNTELIVYLFEIIDDFNQIKVHSCLNKLRTQIRDASSLLYDLSPVYIGINLGSVFGFVNELPINEYYLLRREGMYFGDRQLLITILKHPDHYYKILGFDVALNEEFSLSLDIHDILELTNTPDAHSLLMENETATSNLILANLTLVKKEVNIVLL